MLNDDYPPYAYLFQVAEHCPKAVATYLRLWRDRSDESLLYFDLEDFRQNYCMSLAKFKHDLFLLTKECLVNVEERPSQIVVELVEWDEEFLPRLAG
jgi:hypothetical protein